MTEQIDLIKLYSTRILALAAQMPHVGRLDNPECQRIETFTALWIEGDR